MEANYFYLFLFSFILFNFFYFLVLFFLAYMSQPCHVNIILKEKTKSVELPKPQPGETPKRIIRFTKKEMAARRLKVGGGH